MNDVSCRGGQNGSIDITVTGGNTPYGYTWTKNGSSISATSQDLNNISAGEYQVTILDNKGCSTSRTVVIDQPLDSINATNVSSNVTCNGLLDGAIALTVTGGTTPYAYTWTKAGDLLFGSSNKDINTLAAGSYYLEIEDNNGCTLLDTIAITQPNVLNAVKDTAIDPACSAVPSGSVQITVSGGTTPYAYHWTNSAAPSYLQTTQDIYSLYSGNYRGIVTDANGCKDTVTATISAQIVEADFDAIPQNCDGTYQLVNNSIGADNYTWLIQGVAPTGLNQRVYCTTTDTVIIMDFNPGEYKITLTVSSNEGCVDSMVKNIIIMPQPIALFAYEPIPCSSGIKFTNLSVNGAITSWNFGDPSSGVNNTSTSNHPTHTFSSNGVYNVTLIAGDVAGCKDTITRSVTVQSTGITPTAAFTHSVQNSACATKVFFTNTSSNANTYLWLFDDGSSSNLENPTKSYPVAGSYQVQLISFSATGCTDTVEHTVVISNNSYGTIAKFVANDSVQCKTNNRFNFINQSLYYGPGWVSDYAWDFGDGTSNNTNTFVYDKQYANAGIYQVRLIATSPNGCKDTAYQMLRVLPEADPTFIMTIGCGMVAALERTADPNVSYVWSFGDGNFASNHLDSFSHTFTTPGKYDIRLTTYTPNGCSTSYSIGTLASDGRLPEPDFFYYVACANNIQFKNTSEWGSSYIWDFGDGSPADSSYEPYHSYAAAGTYNVTLTVYNSPQCLKSITYAVVAPQGWGVKLPRARMAYWVQPCTNTTFARDSSSKDASNFKWYLNNVHVATGANVSIPGPGVGMYQLMMIADNGVCADTTYGGFEIQPEPIAGFDILTNTCSNTIMVSSNSKHATSYEWNFDDAGTLTNTSYGASASHTFSANGTYNVRLIAYNITGCADTLVKSITVNNANSLNQANFTYVNGLCNCKCQNTVKFNNLTPGSGNTYFWTFGDGTSSVQANPRKGFPAAGDYIVTLTSVDASGCMSTKSMEVTIDASVNGPSAAFSTDYQVQCVDSNSFNFYNHSAYLGAGWINKYYWYFGDGTMDSTNSFIYNKKYTTAGNYIVTLVAVGVEGCRDTMSMYIQVRALPCTGVLKFVNLQDGSNWNVDPGMGGILNSVKEVNNKMQFNLYPNPNVGSFSIEVKGLSAKTLSIEVRDIAGRLIFEQRNVSNRGGEIPMNMGEISEGAYMVRIISEEGETAERKFVVVK
jgi:PKD repeat protein